MGEDGSEAESPNDAAVASSGAALDDLTSSLKSVSLSSSSHVLLIDSLKTCAEAMGVLIDRAEPVAVDFEGIALSREGRVCLAQIASTDESEPVYLVDIVALGADAFGVGRLGELLSSETLVKLIFDCRSDREALQHQFGVALNQVYDIQVVYCMRCDEVAGHRVGRLRGLRAALGDCPGLDSEARRKLEETKDAGSKMFIEEDGESSDAWERRPLPPELVDYAAVDVRYLHAMYKEWRHFMKQGKMDKVVAKRKRKKKGSARDF
jgi:exonuclease 3'-5' domain-containing protein 1